eukprot:4951132-Amphidinium_carterae.1
MSSLHISEEKLTQQPRCFLRGLTADFAQQYSWKHAQLTSVVKDSTHSIIQSAAPLGLPVRPPSGQQHYAHPP